MRPDIRLAFIAACIVSFSFFVFGALGLFFPSALGWSTETALLTKLILAAFLLSPYFTLLPALRLHQGTVRSYKKGESAVMLLKLEVITGSNSPTYTACLRVANGDSRPLRLQVYAPKKRMAVPEGEIEAKVFCEPESGAPMVIEAGNLKLWSMN